MTVLHLNDILREYTALRISLNRLEIIIILEIFRKLGNNK